MQKINELQLAKELIRFPSVTKTDAGVIKFLEKKPEALNLLNNKNVFEKMSKLHNPYGDGLASKRIVEFIKKIK